VLNISEMTLAGRAGNFRQSKRLFDVRHSQPKSQPVKDVFLIR
jgi:hypothetical protein